MFNRIRKLEQILTDHRPPLSVSQVHTNWTSIYLSMIDIGEENGENYIICLAINVL